MRLDFPQIHIGLSRTALVTQALRNQEGVLSTNGALSVRTGKRTGRSPKDRFIVKDRETEDRVDWGDVNQPFDPKDFDALWDRAYAYLEMRPVYKSYLRIGADEKAFLPLQVITEKAWHNLFARNMFIQSDNDSDEASSWAILNASGFRTEPSRDKVNSDGAVLLNFTKRRILLVGMLYAGEMKKSMFTVLNYFLPREDILPMHCAANVGKDGNVALFFGLSGTGKTTLSSDPKRHLIGDDEHGWSASGVFNFEGGCYAKCINLSKEKEPVIWDAIRDGAVMENVVLKADGEPDYADGNLTQNTRAAYPREYLPLQVKENKAGLPQSVIFLTCDLYGVLPPVALLDENQAAYYFLSGYTALVASTEGGSGTGVVPTFSACFGAPFFPLSPIVYAELLMKRIKQVGCQVYLVNTGWTGGGYGVGERLSILTTRKIIDAILTGGLRKSPTERMPGFNITIPKVIAGLDSCILNPRQAWKDPKAFDQQMIVLMKQFHKNFLKFEIRHSIRKAGPVIE